MSDWNMVEAKRWRVWFYIALHACGLQRASLGKWIALWKVQGML